MEHVEVQNIQHGLLSVRDGLVAMSEDQSGGSVSGMRVTPPGPSNSIGTNSLRCRAAARLVSLNPLIGSERPLHEVLAPNHTVWYGKGRFNHRACVPHALPPVSEAP